MYAVSIAYRRLVIEGAVPRAVSPTYELLMDLCCVIL